MAEKLTVIPHDFDFIEDNRAQLVMVGTKLDSRLNRAQLLPDANGDYPTSGDQTITTGLYRPKAVRAWLGFQVDITHAFDGPDNQLTSASYRIGDGTNQWFWNGVAWSIATTQWNSETEIANNITSFPATARQIQFIIKLATTSKFSTPLLMSVHLAWSGKFEAFEDLIYRSLVPLLKTARLITDFAIKVPPPSSLQMDILTPRQRAGYQFDVVDVESVFNNDLDPDHYDNLLSTYDINTGVATLTTTITPGQFALCRLVLRPQVAVISTAQDYIEVEATPAIQVSEIEARDSSPLAMQVGVTNKATGDIIVIQPPYRFDLVFTMICLTPGGVDMMRILRSVIELMEANPTITSTAIDEQYRIYMMDEFTSTTTPQSNNLHSMRATFCIKDVLAFERPSIFTKAVGRVNLNLAQG